MDEKEIKIPAEMGEITERKDVGKPVPVIELDITPERLDELTWEQWEIIEKAPKLNPAEARSILSVFVKGMTPEDGYKALGKLKTKQMNETLYAFAEAVNKLKNVDPPSGG